MPLSAGTRIGPYEVTGALGAGGMGEVYRARDTKLGRDVALKILPDLFSTDTERQARFRREATLLASLNHPNIGHVYGFEDAASPHALVLELVEGPTLAERLSQGPLDVSEALSIARQIVDAMDAAHEAGIIHRDLKPANIKIRPDGTVKVLDFGLAKALASSSSSTDVANSPTLTSPAQTAMGIVLGTAAYMSPEQARGRAVDKRADIWAFGCVLFEMLARAPAFAGDNVTDTLAAVVRGEPEWAALPADAPASVKRLLRRCLAKDLRHRLSDIGVARLEIDDALKPADAQEATVSVRHDIPAPRAWPVLAVVAFVAGGAVAALAAWMLRPGTPLASPPMQLALTWPEGQQWSGNNGAGVSIAPDGRHLAYFAGMQDARVPRLYVRQLADDQVHVVPGSDGGYGSFFSPDGEQVAFAAAGKLWRAPVAGGAAFEIGSVNPADRGAVWSTDGFIYSGGPSGLSRIAASGGSRESLTTVNTSAGEVGHRFPAVVPGRNAVLFTVFKGSLDEARIAALDLDTKAVHLVLDLPGHSPFVTSTGHLLYLRSGVLMAARLDTSRLQVTGTSEPVLNGVAFNNGGAAHFALSNAGTLVFVPDSGVVTDTSLAWADRAGKLTAVDVPPAAYTTGALSPDGGRVALVRVDPRGQSAIVVWNFSTGTMTSVTREAGNYASPVWTPDGRSLVFTHRRQIGGFGRMLRQPADGSADAAPVLSRSAPQVYGSSGDIPGSFDRNGKKLFYAEVATESAGVWAVDLETGVDERVIAERSMSPRISPDGRWLAFLVEPSSETSAAGAIRVQSAIVAYPEVSRGRWPAGPPGAFAPRWSSDGREMFYLAEQGIFSQRIGSGPSPTTAAPQLLVSSPGGFGWYDVAPDGQRFLVAQFDRALRAPTPRVIVNWFEMLKDLR